MRTYSRISADSHIDMPWMPNDLFTANASAELKDRILSIVEAERGSVMGLAEMYIGTMHGYALDLVQRLVPETFKYQVLTDITARMLVDRMRSTLMIS